MIGVAFVSLGILCAVFIGWPLLTRRTRALRPSSASVMRAFFRQRAQELDAESDEETNAAMRAELDALILTEVDAQAETESDDRTADTSRASSIGLLVAAVVLPLAGFGLFTMLSDSGLSEIRGAEAVLTVDAAEQATLESWARKLRHRVETHRGDSKSWYLLGHAELKLGRFGAAAEAFSTTNTLTPGDMSVQVYWLQARYLDQRGVLDEISRGLAQELLASQPNLSVVLEILAMDAYRQGHLAEAVRLLNRALGGTRDLTQQASFVNAIQQVREQLAGTEAADELTGINVEVATLDPPPQQATIFVIARPVGGGMPYAVVRRPAILAPFTVRLDDLVSMSEARKLTDAENFEVIVRLSLRGVAMAHPGDWQWQSEPLTTAALPAVGLQAQLKPPG